MAALKKTVLFFVISLFLAGNAGWAEDTSIREELNQLKARIQALENKLAEQDKCIEDQNQCILDQNKKITEYESKLAQFDTTLHRQVGAPISIAEGLEIGAGATIVLQSTNNTNNASAGVPKKKSRTDASYSADLTLAKEFEKIDGRAFLHLEAGQGAGLEDNLTLYSNVNRDADNHENVRVTELWYEQGLFKNTLAVTFGKLDPTVYFDNNEAANDETTQFLGRIFRNSPTIEFPDNTAAVRIAYTQLEWLELKYGVFDAKSNWERILDNLFHIGEVEFKTEFASLPGNYRFLGWSNGTHHTKWLDVAKTEEGTFGFGLSFDQKIHDAVTAFARYGWQYPEVYNTEITTTGDCNFSLAHSWSAGFQLEGKPWHRDDDVLGVAVGQIFPSRDYKKAGESLDPARMAESEGHLEVYYRIYINKHLSISPDFQYIWNPFGKDVTEDTNSIFVGGARAQVDF